MPADRTPSCTSLRERSRLQIFPLAANIRDRFGIGARVQLRTFLLFLIVFAAPLWAAQRTTLSLDGQWDIADSVDGEGPPAAYSHKAPVPGLAHSAVPGFKDVDEFESRQLIQNRVDRGLAPASALVSNAGVSRQERNWFWYRRRFDVPVVRGVAVLRIDKAQFGAAVW